MISSPRSRPRWLRKVALGAAALLAISPAFASETITYAYDTRGRLVQVTRSGTVNNGANANYCYDRAENRTYVATTTSGGSTATFALIGSASAIEGNPVVFTVTKCGPASGTLTVNYATSGGTATSGSDFTATSGTLSFLAGDTAKSISVPTINESTTENAENFTVMLSNASAGSTIGTATGTGTINDNPPVANSDNAGSMDCGDAITFNVVANDTDPDGHYPLGLVSASASSSGIFVSVFSGTDIRIISSGGFSGTKGFSYVVQNGLGAQSTGTGTINVLAPCP